MASRSSSERRPRFVAGVLLLLAAVGGAGCGHWRSRLVKPHQRAYLADRIMRNDGNRLGAAADQHVLQTREGAFGGNGTAGGGCGCN